MAVPLSSLRHLRAVPEPDLLIGVAIIASGALEAFTVAVEYGAVVSADLAGGAGL